LVFFRFRRPQLFDTHSGSLFTAYSKPLIYILVAFVPLH